MTRDEQEMTRWEPTKAARAGYDDYLMYADDSSKPATMTAMISGA
jgi:hypothetical protein